MKGLVRLYGNFVPYYKTNSQYLLRAVEILLSGVTVKPLITFDLFDITVPQLNRFKKDIWWNRQRFRGLKYRLA